MEGGSGGGAQDAQALPTLACIQTLERLFPTGPTSLLLSEMAKGRLMEGVGDVVAGQWKPFCDEVQAFRQELGI